ncbi:MAG: DUF455 family protein [Opitutaceae bacterium]
MPIQLQEFAKQVLFGTTIEEKLSFPREEIIDTRPGAAIVTPRTLTRPKHLMLREDGVRANHPSIAKLVDEKERGRLLHFFGNHELLATELMALVLLKFPDAPASFRRGVLETLKEEQIHTRMYMHRMQQCGVEFGELPLSDYFWKSVSSMEDPLDYVTRLSLTFEQANLDYSREYAKVFNQVGDHDTAKILDKIYRDEIDHVGFGLKWFRKWKAHGKTDWEAYRERLIFPLSPARAKGNDFNIDGRQDAGLDIEFINDLKLFQQSKGRTPSVYWFNPLAEQAAAQNTAETQTSPLQSDLAYLPAYLSRKDDLLIMAEPPSPAFLQQLQNYGFHLPEILSNTANTAPKIVRKIADLRPWAWSPDSVAFFKDTLPSVTRPIDREQLWNNKRRQLFSKVWCAEWAKDLQDGSDAPFDSLRALSLPKRQARTLQPTADWIAPVEVYGKPATDLNALLQLREHFNQLGYPDIVCKAPFGTAANGNRCIKESDTIDGPLLDWLNSIWSAQGELLVEPWLDRVFDCSVQFERRDEQTKVVAFTRMLNNARGQFRGILTNGFCKGLDSELVRFLMERTEGRPRIYHYYEHTIVQQLDATLEAMHFTGPLGIDAFVYRTPAGELRLKPIVEINPRYTMGRVAHELGEHNAPGSVGFFEIITKSQLKKTPHKTFADFCHTLETEHPVSLTNETKPRINTGSFPLTDPQTAKQFLALYHVREHIEQLDNYQNR